jgi:hypothetical protein
MQGEFHKELRQKKNILHISNIDNNNKSVGLLHTGIFMRKMWVFGISWPPQSWIGNYIYIELQQICWITGDRNFYEKHLGCWDLLATSELDR